ncbi:BQ2448_1473 [Microbotryum intermedium]|uniref:rRNA-processing protein FYV7 n=1 Tax=Microbotryum intermedium TaxID=269621 RepID=A0A238FBB9_9BASI|nr:BQ2448_1473 [Microbotryum intermedium]
MAGHKPRSKPLPTGNDDKKSNRGGLSKGGFKIGPKLGKGVYQGHAQKIKKTLIHKAKVKRSYAKDLAQAGYATASHSAASLRPRPLPPHKAITSQDDEQEQEEGVDSLAEKESKRNEMRERMKDHLGIDGEDEEEGGNSEEEEGGRGRGSGARALSTLRVWGAPMSEERKEELRKEEEDRLKAPAVEVGQGKGSKREREPRQPKGRGRRAESSVGTASPAAAPTTKPSRPLPFFALPPKEEEKKKRPRLNEDEIQAVRKKREEEKKKWNQRGRNGQPKLGGRVEQLLARIQQGMQ